MNKKNLIFSFVLYSFIFISFVLTGSAEAFAAPACTTISAREQGTYRKISAYEVAQTKKLETLKKQMQLSAQKRLNAEKSVEKKKEEYYKSLRMKASTPEEKNAVESAILDIQRAESAYQGAIAQASSQYFSDIQGIFQEQISLEKAQLQIYRNVVTQLFADSKKECAEEYASEKLTRQLKEAQSSFMEKRNMNGLKASLRKAAENRRALYDQAGQTLSQAVTEALARLPESLKN